MKNLLTLSMALESHTLLSLIFRKKLLSVSVALVSKVYKMLIGRRFYFLHNCILVKLKQIAGLQIELTVK